jgi:hypothetical protein
MFRFRCFFVLLILPSTQCAIAADDAPPSFRNDVMAVLARSGCSLGTCHGNQNGKGGLKLSLRGQDPDGDFVTLTRRLASRRVNVMMPDDSLLLRKPSMQVPHEGGRRFASDSAEYQILRDWIAADMPADADSTPRLVRLDVTPAAITLLEPQRSTPLNATATFSDGSKRDVTTLAVLESSDPAVRISADGTVTFGDSQSSRQTSVTVRYLNQQATARVEFVPARPGFEFTAPAAANSIDSLVFAQLKRLQINPSPVCDDTTFLRRVYLDVTGRLPTVSQTHEFLDSTAANKRSALIDRLLTSPEFVDFQSLRWADLLRVEVKTLDTKGVEVFYHWIHDSIATGKPLNQFAAEIISARGSTYTDPPSNFYRALRTPEERAESAAQVFLGVRLQCAKCHNHPFDHWTQDDYYGWTNFFARVDYKIIENNRRDTNDKHEFDGEQIVFMKEEGNVKNPTTGKTAGLRYLGDGDNAASDDKSADRLQQLALWLGLPDNHRFATTQANRIWFQLLGQGIVDPIDDFRSTNPPSNPELLDAITKEFIANGYRVRDLMRLILNSQTYQLSSEPNETNRDDATSFSHAIPHRLTAEQTIDAISQVLDVSAKFGGYPDGTRAVQLTGVRNGGHRYSRPEVGDRFLALFGKPSRLLTCECERTGETTLAQTMEMVSGELITELLNDRGNRVAASLQSNETATQFIDNLWWTALSRSPTQDESTAMLSHLANSRDPKSALQDIAWSVLNSNEFLLRR